LPDLIPEMDNDHCNRNNKKQRDDPEKMPVREVHV
jgi:hypothetical protein